MENVHLYEVFRIYLFNKNAIPETESLFLKGQRVTAFKNDLRFGGTASVALTQNVSLSPKTQMNMTKDLFR